MKKFFLIVGLIIFTTSSLAGSCPMLWSKVESKLTNISDDNLKSKIRNLIDAGKKAHSDGDHLNSEKLLKEALDLIKN